MSSMYLITKCDWLYAALPRENVLLLHGLLDCDVLLYVYESWSTLLQIYTKKTYLANHQSSIRNVECYYESKLTSRRKVIGSTYHLWKDGSKRNPEGSLSLES